MSTITICYGTTDGQTAVIAEYISRVFSDLGHRAPIVDLRDGGDGGQGGLDAADAVLVGASIHVNQHAPYVVEFVRNNLSVLQAVPSAFFSVSLSAQGDAAKAAGYIEDFCAATGWRPADTLAVAGALRYTAYGFVKRQLMKQVARDKGLGTDTTRDFTYTDWSAVRSFVEQFATEATGVHRH
ncbi:MAG: hypothetical protein L0H41_09170 [Microlunatus sp.]|nr:hypothetical protein [Microlunatus sp.]MDN5771616.1 hypothetical protein [Microlunatus sp.]MDN5804469.1 hypothetical protein [Microlunatus sp.]